MQVQRGMSASKLAISSVGGTINVITNAAEMRKGGKFSVNLGNDAYQKYGLVLSTGMGDNGLAFTVQGTYSTGNGWVDGTAFKASSYFASLAWKVNDKHSLHFTGLGAPQWHHQRSLSNFDGVNINTYEAHPRGYRYNHLWGDLDGEEFTWRRNFYHKPIAFINWYWTISEKTELATTAYGSWGRGGGTGPRGRINGSFETSGKFKDGRYSGTYDHDSDPNTPERPIPGQVDWDNIVEWNSGGTNYPASYGAPKEPWATNAQNPGIDNEDGFFADKYVNTSRDGFIRRSSMNSHNWYGMLSTLTHELSDNLNLIAGIDYRAYTGIHYRRQTDRLGSDAYFTDTDVNIAGEFISQEKPASAVVDMTNDRRLAYWNDGIVGWFGGFFQLEYSKDNLSAHISSALSNQSYQRVDYFTYYTSDELNTLAGNTSNQTSEKVNLGGGNVKAGLNYNINQAHNIYLNGGYFSRQPLFDAVFPGFRNDVNERIERGDSMNETITGIELGYGFRSTFLDVNVNIYNTSWSDRFVERGTTLPSGEPGSARYEGISQTHTGFELEAYGEIATGLRLDAMLGVGNWLYDSDVTARLYDDNQNEVGSGTTLYLDGVKVGDAAQMTTRVGLTYEIVRGLRVYGSWYYADNLYAQFNIFSGFDDNSVPAEDRVLQLPNYQLVDAGLYYDFEAAGLDWTFRFNVNNILGEEYYSESLTNETDPALFGTNIAYPGFGTTWNTALAIRF
jgi:hypothetical protein